MSKGKDTGKNDTVDHRRQDVRQAVKNACDQMRNDGVDPRNYVEQLAWLFFLKAFDETESPLEQEVVFDRGIRPGPFFYLATRNPQPATVFFFSSLVFLSFPRRRR